MNHVQQLLSRVTGALSADQVPYAVIGGNAVAAWVATIDDGAIRATKDVDLLIRRDDLEHAKLAVSKVDLDYHEVLGVSMFLTRVNPNPKTGVHLLFAQEFVREGDLEPAPGIESAWMAKDGFLVLDLLSLVRMKLLANRLRDQVHIQDMIEMGLITEEIEAILPFELRKRLQHIRTLR